MQPGAHLGVDRVAGLGSVDGDERHGAAHLEQNRIAHRRTPRVDRGEQAPLAYQIGTGGTASGPTTTDPASPAAQPCSGAARRRERLLNTSSRLDARTLLDLVRSGTACAPLSPLEGTSHALVELDAHVATQEADRGLLSGWLGAQACPVIGISTERERHELAFACDAVVQDASEASELIANIEGAPLAAMVLVQLLRATEGLAAAPALVMESLAYATLQDGKEFRRWLARTERPAAAVPQEEGPPVLIERNGAQLSLCLNRPARRNALSVEMRDALVEALEFAALDSSVSEVVIRGAGRCFSAGGDLSEFGSVSDPSTAHAVRSTRSVPQLLARCAGKLRCEVHGAAVGAGMELAAFGARVQASPDTFFQLPEIRFGLIPGSGGCVSIPRRIGRLRTGLLALSGRRLDARTAHEWGLVDQLAFPAVAARSARA
ncbi:MAG: enoyl-CoA hydratase/isomerase family protein [Proteobacteria bacterium]|nr:enoyl-CoA hydratase/isomerase family protein [Pseudomonadota bacterium]